MFRLAGAALLHPGPGSGTGGVADEHKGRARRRRPADVMGINQGKYLRGHENVIITFATVIKRQSFIEINTAIKRNDGITYSTDVVTSASPAAPRRPSPPPLSLCFIKLCSPSLSGLHCVFFVITCLLHAFLLVLPP